MKISLVTPVFNRLDLTRACLESLRRTLAGWDYEWILIDDVSTDGTRDFLRTLPDEDARIRVVFNDTPRGFAANNNHGARLARAPLLCLLNNDTVLLPGWLEPMARLARLLPDVACVGNVQREPVSGLVDHAGIYFDPEGNPQHAAKDAPAPPREDYLEWPAVTAACCVIRREVFLGLDGFDEAFLNGSEDLDFCLRARTRGYRHFVANRSVIYHHISASPGRKQSEENNRRLFRERWLPRLQSGFYARPVRGQAQGEGRRYLRKHAAQPWRYNTWRVCRALEQVLSPGPPSRQLDLVPRVLFAAQDFLRLRARSAATPPAVAGAGTPVFLVVGDTVLTRERAGVPAAVRNLAGACGRLGAPVLPVRWQPITRSLCPLPPELSVGLDAETLRREAEPPAPSLCDPSVADRSEAHAETLSLHELSDSAAVPRGAWIVLPEVWDGHRTGQLVEYAHKHGWRLAVVLYDLMPTNEPGLFPFGAAHEHSTYLSAISAADFILPVSNVVAADWHRFVAHQGLPSPPVKVCVPGADTCTRTRGTVRPPRPPSAPVRMLCVSAVVPHKNHRTLLAAFDLVVAARPDLELELFLLGMPRLFTEDNVPAAVGSFAERHRGRVRWAERVEYSALSQLYQECDFTVFPSKFEGWGLPIVESLWFGRPCICANYEAMAEAAAGGGCVTVDVRDPQALADAILSLADSPERLAAVAAEIGPRPLKTWEEYARELFAVLPAF